MRKEGEKGQRRPYLSRYDEPYACVSRLEQGRRVASLIIVRFVGVIALTLFVAACGATAVTPRDARTSVLSARNLECVDCVENMAV